MRANNDSASIGHNGGPTFDDIVRENMDRGLLLSMKEVIVEAVRDPRLDRRHLRVLAEVIDHINSSTGTSFPGHKTIAEGLRRYNVDGYPDQGYSEQGIRNTISDLVNCGYLVSVRRAGEKGGRALAHYSIRKPPRADLQEMITDWIMAQRTASARVHPMVKARHEQPSDVTQAGDVTSRRDVISQGDVRQEGDVTHSGYIRSTYSTSTQSRHTNQPADVTHQTDVIPQTDVTSDVISPVAPVTNTKELESVSDGARARTHPMEARGYPEPLAGEEHQGHGVYANGETIRHAEFAISLPGIQMQTLNAGMTANEVRAFCLAHALQWGVEIENGQRPDKVLPSKISNFLARSIMGSVNQARSQAVRERREQAPRPPFGNGTANGSVPQVETRAERLARLAADMEKGDRP